MDRMIDDACRRKCFSRVGGLLIVASTNMIGSRFCHGIGSAWIKDEMYIGRHMARDRFFVKKSPAAIKCGRLEYMLDRFSSKSMATRGC